MRGCGAAEKLAEEIAGNSFHRRQRLCARASGATKIKSAEIEVNIFGRRAAISCARTWSAARAGNVESKLVVHLPFFRVGKNFVGFLNLLEFFFGGFVAGIQVGMIFASELPVCRANVFHARFARDA